MIILTVGLVTINQYLNFKPWIFFLHIPLDVTLKKDIYNMLSNLFILADSQ